MSNNIEELGKIINAQMKKAAAANMGITVELGSINRNRALVVNSLNNAIPKGSYMVALRLTLPSLLIKTKETALNTEEAEEHSHTIDKHLHDVELPKELRGLKPGDRVIVAWIGTEPVVVDIVVSS